MSESPSPPRWLLWMLPPLLTPLAAIAWLFAHWQQLPLRYAMHFDSTGLPDGWQTRTARHLFGPLIFAEGMALWILALAWFAWRATGKRGKLPPMAKILVAVSYLLCLIFTAVGLLPVVQIPIWPVALMGPFGAIALLVYLTRMKPDPVAEESTDGLFVPMSMGVGYTINMSHRGAYGFIGTVAGGILLLAGFLLWSQR